jgi:Sulfotransferase domain
MQVLALGMPRTGTLCGSVQPTSSVIANERLHSPIYRFTEARIPSYHISECALDAENGSVVYWDQAIDAKLFGKGKKWEGKDFDKMLWRYDVCLSVVRTAI